MIPGQRVNWQGFSQAVPAVLCKIGPKRVQIEVRVREPYGQRRWLPELKWVPKDTVSPRVLPCAAFYEPMVLQENGFTVKAWKHPTGVSSQYPSGIWYGEIDGYRVHVGSPWPSEESALHEAYQMLHNGRYRITLLDAIEHYERCMGEQTDQKYRSEAVATLPDLHERLSKVEKIMMASEPTEVRILRGNPDRGAETGPLGYGRQVPALFLREFDQTGHNVKCRLLVDDPNAVGKPNAAGEEGWWCVSQIVWGEKNHERLS